jgi:hypothetical protein
MAVRYQAEVNRAGRDIAVTLFVNVAQGPYKTAKLRIGKAFLQPRLWEDTLAPLLWGTGWIIQTADGRVLDAESMGQWLAPDPLTGSE